MKNFSITFFISMGLSITWSQQTFSRQFNNSQIERSQDLIAEKTKLKPNSDLDLDTSFDLHDAFFYFNRAKKIAPSDRRAALLDLNKAIEIHPKYAEAYAARGNIKIILSDHKSDPQLDVQRDAILDFDRAIKFGHRIPVIYMSRGFARFKVGDKKGGIVDIDRAAEIYHKQGDTMRYRNMTVMSQMMKNEMNGVKGRDGAWP
jgi:tetratricopeptide (TPR) repeat protein